MTERDLALAHLKSEGFSISGEISPRLIKDFLKEGNPIVYISIGSCKGYDILMNRRLGELQEAVDQWEQTHKLFNHSPANGQKPEMCEREVRVFRAAY